MAKRNSIYIIALSDSATTATSNTSTDPITPAWALLVQPKSQPSKWFRHSTAPHALVLGPHGHYRDVPHASILLKVLIVENDSAEIGGAVERSIAGLNVSSETWIQEAVKTLQSEGLVERFDVEKVMEMAGKKLVEAKEMDRCLVVDREGRDIGEDIGNRGGGKVKEKKGWWVSYGPNAGVKRRPQPKYSWERKDAAYGGLM